MAENFTNSTIHSTSTQFSLSMIIVVSSAGVVALVSIMLSLSAFFCICIDEEKTIKLQTAASIRQSILVAKRRRSSGKGSVTSPKRGTLKTSKKKGSLKTNRKKASLRENNKSLSKSKYNNGIPSTTSKSYLSESQFSDVFDSHLKKRKKVPKTGPSSKSQSFGKWNILPNKTLFKSKSKNKSRQKTLGIVFATPNV